MRRLMSLLTRTVWLLGWAFLMLKARDRMRLSTESVLKTAWPFLAAVAFLEDDTELPAVGQADAFAQPARAAEAVQHAGDGARVLAQLGGFPLEPVNLLDDLDRQEDIVLLEVEQGIGVMEQDIGVKNVVLFHERTT